MRVEAGKRGGVIGSTDAIIEPVEAEGAHVDG